MLVLLFAAQFPVTGTTGRLLLAGVHGAAALAAFAAHRRHLPATLLASWRPGEPRDVPSHKIPWTREPTE